MKEFQFFCDVKGSARGYVKAKTKEEALQKFKNREYEDYEVTDENLVLDNNIYIEEF